MTTLAQHLADTAEVHGDHPAPRTDEAVPSSARSRGPTAGSREQGARR